MSAMDTIKEAITCLDRMHREPSTYEAKLLNSLILRIRSSRLPTPNQYRVLCEMAEKYLDDPALLRDLLHEQSTIERAVHDPFA